MSQALQHTAVIGGSGYLGEAVTKRLLELDVQTRIVDMRPPRFEVGKATFVACDIREALPLAEALRGVQTVIHLAGVIDIRRHYHPTASQEINVGGTGNVLRACRGVGVHRMVYVSTSNVLMEETRPFLDMILILVGCTSRRLRKSYDFYRGCRTAEERECIDVTEESPAPPRQCTEYSRTKLLAESLVLEEALREDGMPLGLC